MRRRFFPRRTHRIPYGIIFIAAGVALLVVIFLAFRFLMPGCNG